MFNIINKSPLLLLVFLAPIFFISMPLTAMDDRKRLATQDIKKIKRQKTSLTRAQQKKIDHDLYDAINNDNLENVITALNAGADAATKKETNVATLEFPIEAAVWHCSSPDIFKALFSRGADSQIQTNLQKNLLHRLLESPYKTKPHFIEAIKTLLQHKVSLHLVDYENNTPLHLVTEAYEKCATNSKEPNSHVQWEQNLPIFYHAIELLLFAGADHKKTNKKNKKALDLIAQKNQEPIERLINLASFFNLNLSKNLPNLLPLHLQIPGISTIILNYYTSHPTKEEQKLWDELAPIRDIQQELLMAPVNGLPEEEEEKQ